MTPVVGGTTVLLVGVMLIRLAVTDAYQRYVRVGMGPWLLLSGLLLALLGAASVVSALRGSRSDRVEQEVPDQTAGADPDHAEQGGHAEHGEHEEHGDRIGWLLLVPVLALLLVVPPALGSFGVDRSRVRAGGVGEFQSLPAGPQPRPLSMLEFSQRAFDHDGSTLRGVQLRITGFVAKPSDGASFELARYQIACCAADAVAAVARVAGAPGAAPTRDAWFTVTGTFGGIGTDGVPEFLAAAVQQIAAPVDPYE